MNLLIHHPLSSPKTFHSPPPPKPFIHHRVSFTTTPKTLSINTHCVFAAATSAASLKEKKVVQAFGLLKAMIDKGIKPNLISLNEVIYGLIGEEWLRKEAREEYGEMKRKGLSADYKMVIAEYKHKNLTRAVELLNHMRGRGLSLNERTYTSLVDSLLFESEWETEGAKVFLEMVVRGFLPSVVTFNRLLDIYCRDGKFDEAMGILRGMVSPNVASYNTLIYRLCLEDKDKKFKVEVDKALQLKAKMVEKGILPDAVTYNSLLMGMCWPRSRRLSEAFDLFQEILRRGLSLDKSSYKTLMTAFCVEGEFSKAFSLHDEMIKKGFLHDFVWEFSPLLVTYNAFIYGYCSLDMVEEAVGILRGMPEMGLSPDGVSFGLVISGFCRIGEMRKAYEMMKGMGEKDMLDRDTYSSLMQDMFHEVTYSSLLIAYLNEGELLKVAQLYDDMVNNSSLPHSITYSVFFNGLDKKAWTTETKKYVLRQIYNDCRDVPTYLTYDTLIENCSNNEFRCLVELVKRLCISGSENAYDIMPKWNYKPDGAVYNLFVLEHCKCGNVHKAYNMYKEMVHYGFASHVFSVLTLIYALSCKRMDNERRWVIQNTLRSYNLNDSELLKALPENDVQKAEIDALLNVLAEKVMDGLLLNGGKCLIGNVP